MKVAPLCILVIMHTSAYAIEKMDCYGTEPFWDATIDNSQLVFSYDEKKRIYPLPTFEAPGGTNPDYITSVQARTKNGSAIGFIVNETCSDGMSDKQFPYSIYLFVNGRPFRGCCFSATHPIK